MPATDKNPWLAALEWHLAIGADEGLSDTPVDRTLPPVRKPVALPMDDAHPAAGGGAAPRAAPLQAAMAQSSVVDGGDILGTAAAREEAARIARDCNTLDELHAAIAAFDGLGIKRNAMNMVFADGLADSGIMLIAESPGDVEDREGRAFAGPDGQLLDRMLAAIKLSRSQRDGFGGAYLTYMLNWRPPGGRGPTVAELDIALPLIERHIALVNPSLLILCGGAVAKTILGKGEAISRLRGRTHDYKFRTKNISGRSDSIPAIVTYDAGYLLKTPSQKRFAWQDWLRIESHISG